MVWLVSIPSRVLNSALLTEPSFIKLAFSLALLVISGCLSFNWVCILLDTPDKWFISVAVAVVETNFLLLSVVKPLFAVK